MNRARLDTDAPPSPARAHSSAAGAPGKTWRALAERESAATLDEAYAYCERLTKTHYENFTVGSWLVPRARRRHVHALYAFCRGVDDLGDELGAPGAERLALLANWRRQLDAAFAPDQPSDQPGEPLLATFQAVRASARALGWPREPFARLIEANVRDQTTPRYDTFEALIEYCRHSATPVGRLFLRIFGHDDAALDALSDETCIALQLANFWQDIERDRRERDRIYVPRESWQRFGVSEAEFAAPRASANFRLMVRFEVDRAEAYFQRGWELLARVGGRLRFDLELFTRGGLAILQAIRDADYDTLAGRPTFSKRRKIALMLRLLLRPPWSHRHPTRFPGTRGH